MTPEAKGLLESVVEASLSLKIGTEKPLTKGESLVDHNLGARNIHAFMYAPKIKEGKATDEYAVVFMVIRKAPPEEVNPDYLAENVAKRFFPRYLTDVQEFPQIEIYGPNSMTPVKGLFPSLFSSTPEVSPLNLKC